MTEISIILLVKNGERYLEEVLEGIFRQEIKSSFEVLAIDSGSVDQSLSILARFPVQLKQIPPARFNHGETRNEGASLARGAYLVFLTQDATPFDARWLDRLIQPFREDPLVAGAFSRHHPRPDCPLMEKRQILQTVLTAGQERRVNQAAGNPEYEKNPYPFIWFSNTSSCLRREVWERFPFRRLEFAEDQEWAKRILDGGYKTVYVPDSVVVHSHHYTPVPNFRRFFEHARAMKEIFGKDEFPRFKQIFTSTTHSVKEDYRFFRSEGGAPRGFLRWALPSLFWYLSAFVGLWLGTHLECIPFKWRKRLSLQPSLIKK